MPAPAALATTLLLAGLGLVLGRLVLRVLLGGRPGAVLHPLETAFQQATLGLGMLAWMGLALAEAGWLGPTPLLTAGIAAALGLEVAARRGPAAGAGSTEATPVPADDLRDRRARGPRRATAARPRMGPASLLAAAAVVVATGAAYLPGYAVAVAASDATVYAGFSRQVARSGGLVLDDPLLAGLDPDLRRELFRNRTPGDATGEYARFPGGVLIPDIDSAEVTAGFSPLLPVVAALLDGVVELPASRLVTPLAGVGSVVAVLLIGLRLLGPGAGLLAAALLALAFPQVWFARLGTPDVLGQLFLLAGLHALVVAFQGPARLAVGAGMLWGLAGAAKVDLVALLGLVILVLAAASLLGGARWLRARVALLAAGFGAPALHLTLHYLLLPSHYLPYLSRIARLAPVASIAAAGIVVLLLAVLVAVAVLRARGTGTLSSAAAAPTLGALLALGVGLHLVNFWRTFPSRSGDVLAWLAAVLGWPLLVAAAAGTLVALARPLSGRGTGGRDDAFLRGTAGELVLVVVLLVGLAHYGHNPLAPDDPLWALRRLVPTVLPVLALLAAAALFRGARLLRFPVDRAVLAGTCATFLGLLALPHASLVGLDLWEDAPAQVTSVAGRLPDDALVLLSPDLAGSHLATSLAWLHDRRTLIVPGRYPDPRAFRELVEAELDAGRRVLVVLGTPGFHVAAPLLSLGAAGPPVAVTFPRLQEPVTLPPRRLVGAPIGGQLLEVRRRTAPAAIVDVGDVGDDTLVDLRGFHAPEVDPSPGRGPYRWSSEFASIRLPATVSAFDLVVAGARPPGAAPAVLSVFARGIALVEDLELPGAPTEITVTLPGPGVGVTAARAGAARGRFVDIGFRATTFTPAGLGVADDERRLGFRLYRVRMRE